LMCIDLHTVGDFGSCLSIIAPFEQRNSTTSCWPYSADQHKKDGKKVMSYENWTK